MKVVKVVVEIKVDENNISNLYPNYKFNWDSVEEFVKSRIDGLETQEDGTTQQYLKEWGYSITVMNKDSRRSLIDVVEEKAKPLSQGDLVIYEGLPYVIAEVDEDGTYFISDGGMENGFWVSLDEIKTKV